jgi:hypothetical protein
LGIHASPELLVIAQLNCDLSFLKSYRFDAALRDVEHVLQVSELLYQKRLFQEVSRNIQLKAVAKPLAGHLVQTDCHFHVMLIFLKALGPRRSVFVKCC